MDDDRTRSDPAGTDTADRPTPAAELDRAAEPDVTVEVDRVAFQGTYVRVSSIGSTGERPYLLVTGLGMSASYYERLAPNLGEFGPVHALDLPGFAGVPRFRGRVSIERYADAVEHVIDDLGLDDPVLIGHSMGTQIVTEVAARRPALSSVVLISPVVDKSARTWSESAVRFLQAAVHEPMAVRVFAITAYVLCGWNWFTRVMPKMLGYRIEERAADVEAHVLVVRGEYDALVPRQWLRDLARVFPHATLREVVDGAHSVMHAQADAVATLILDHVQGRITDRGVASLQRVRDTTTGTDAERMTIQDIGKVVWARILELVGMAKHDDDLVEDAKTAHARAASEAVDRPDPDPDASTDEDERHDEPDDESDAASDHAPYATSEPHDLIEPGAVDTDPADTGKTDAA